MSEVRIREVFTCKGCGKTTLHPEKDKWYAVIFSWQEMIIGRSRLDEGYKNYYCCIECIRDSMTETLKLG